MIVSGWVARYGTPDVAGRYYVNGSWKDFCDKYARGAVPLVLKHDKAHVIGEVLTLEDRPRGPWMTADVTDEEAAGGITEGKYIGLSAQAVCETEDVDGAGPVSKLALRVLEVNEISVTDDPAHPLALLVR